jgi:hypothetical protein
MKLGSPVRTTIQPLSAPMAMQSAKVRRIAIQAGQLQRHREDGD